MIAQPDELDEGTLRAFVGPNADYYVERWTHHAGGARGFGFNWAAFLLSIAWMAYRGMYRRAILFAVLVEGCELSLYFALRALWPESSAPSDAALWEWLDRIAIIVVGIFLANVANRWYFEHTVERLAKFGPGREPTAENLMAVEAQGGVSWVRAVLFVLVVGGSFALLEYFLPIPR